MIEKKERLRDLSTRSLEDLSTFFLSTMMIAREADEKESLLFRQGRGQLHVSSAGHEGVAGIAPLIERGDAVYCYYRDRALMLGMGVPLYDLALDYFAKKHSSSAGRQMAGHFSHKPLNVISSASPTGLQCLPAAGTSWGFKKENNSKVVFCFMGEACTRQGEFFEAIAFAIQEKLPVVYVIEDNGYGISTPTALLTPLHLGMIPQDILHVMDGRDPLQVFQSLLPIVQAARLKGHPAVVWLKLDRLSSHTSSDDQTKYRLPQELQNIKQQDPLLNFRKSLLEKHLITEDDLAKMEKEAIATVKQTYERAESSEEPDATSIQEHLFAPASNGAKRVLNTAAFPDEEWRMSSAVNFTLDLLLKENDKIILFGEDIEDPKGGVFGLTRNLSSRYPGRIVNSPLAEATIAGTASGLSLAGFLPIFELQFIDFVGPAFHQIVNQIATLRWRSAGQYQCPLILYAPCGGYISNGGPWHTQSNESWFAHVPGLKVYMPSNANDAAELFYHAAYGQDPVLMLLPKSQFQARVKREVSLKLYPEKASLRKSGEHVSLVAWGNSVELALKAAGLAETLGISVEVIDLCSIVPCDWQTIFQSVKKTGRLVVIQEDGRTCSFGQTIIAEVSANEDVWRHFYAPPQLVTKEDVYIGFNRRLETSVLPDLTKVMEKINIVLGRAA